VASGWVGFTMGFRFLHNRVWGFPMIPRFF
jgi:hypothetical protein